MATKFAIQSEVKAITSGVGTATSEIKGYTAALNEHAKAEEKSAEASKKAGETRRRFSGTGGGGSGQGSADKAAAEALRQQQRELARLTQLRAQEVASQREETAQLAIRAGAIGRGAAAEREANIQIQLRNSLLRGSIQAGSAEAQAVEQNIRAQQRYREQLERANAAKQRATQSTFSLRNALFALQAVLATLGIAALVRSSVDLVMQFERVERSLTIVMGSGHRAREAIADLRAESDRMGVSFRETSVSFSTFLAASRGSLTFEQTRDVFLTVTQAMSQLGVSSSNTQLALLALQQMASKGTVSSEELRRQLGEHLPGAMQLAAKALGKTTPEFIKLLESGQILAKDLLPKLSVEIKKAFDVDLSRRVESTRASIERMRNSAEQLKASFGRGFLTGFAGGFSSLQGALGDQALMRQAQEIGRQIGDALRVAAEAAVFLAKNLSLLKAVIAGILAYRFELWMMNLAVAMRNAGGAAAYFGNMMSAAQVKAGLFAAAVVALTWAISSYMTKRAQEAAEFERRKAQREDFLTYLGQLRRRTEDLTQAERDLNWERMQGLQVERGQALRDLAEARRQATVRIMAQPGFGATLMTEQEERAAIEGDRQVAAARRRAEEMTNMVKELIAETHRLEALPKPGNVPGLPDTKTLDETGSKLEEILEKQRRATAAAEASLAAARLPAAERQRALAALAALTEATEAAEGVDKASVDQKKALVAALVPLILRMKEAELETSRVSAASERAIEADKAYRTALAQLADAKARDTAASRELAIQLEAEAIAREDQREGDVLYIELIKKRLAEEARSLRSIELETQAEGERQNRRQALRLVTAELADAQTGLANATAEANLQTEIENTLKARGIELGSDEAKSLEAEIRLHNERVKAIKAATATQQRWAEVRKQERQALAQIDDWREASAAARAYGSDVAQILERNGQLNTATRELAFQERLLAAVRAEELSTGERAGAIRIAQIQAELAQQERVIEGVQRYRAELELAAYAQQPVIDAWQATKATIADVLTDLITGVEVNWKNLLTQMLQMWVRTLIEMVIRARAAKLASEAMGGGGTNGGAGGGWWQAIRQAFGGRGGNTSGGVAPQGMSGWETGGSAATGFSTSGSGAGAASSASTAGLAASLAIVAAFAIVYFTVANWIKSNKNTWTELTIGGRNGSLGVGFSRGVAGSSTYRSGLTKQLEEVIKAIKGTISAIGGQFVSLETELIKVGREGRSKNTKFWVKYGEGLVKNFGRDAQAAMEFATIQAIKASEIRGLSPLVRDAMRLSVAETMEAFNAELATFTEIANINVPQSIGDLRGRIRQLEEYWAALSKLPELTPAVTQGFLDVGSAMVRAYQEAYDRLTGTQPDRAEQLERLRVEARLLDAEKHLRIADLAARLADLKIKEQEIEFRRGQVARGGEIARNEIDVGQVAINAKSALVGAEAQLAKVQLTVAGAQIAAIEEVLRALQSMPDIGGNVRLPGGGGGRRQEREDLRESLLDTAAQTLSAIRQQMRDARQEIARINEEVARLRLDGPEAAAAIAAIHEQLRRAIRERVDAQLDPRMEWNRRLASIREEWAETTEAVREHLEETGVLLVPFWELQAAEAAAVKKLAEEALLSLGTPTEATIARFKSLGDTLRFLEQQVAAGTISADRYAAALAELGDQAYSGLLSGMAQYIQDATLRAQVEAEMREAEYDAKKIQWALEIAHYEELGIMTADQIARLRALLAGLPADLPPVVDGGGGGGSGSNTIDQFFQRQQQARDEAQRLLDQYEEANATAGLSQGQQRLRQIEADFLKIFNTLGRNERTLTAYREAIEALNNSLIDPLRQLQQDLLGGALSGASLGAQIDQLKTQAQSLFALSQTGTAEQRVTALEQLPQVLQQLIQAAQSGYGAGVGYLAIRQFVLAMLARLTGQPNTGADAPSLSGSRAQGNVLLAGDAFLGAGAPPLRSGPAVAPESAGTGRLVSAMDRLASALEANTRSARGGNGTANDLLEESRDALVTIAREVRGGKPLVRKAAR